MGLISCKSTQIKNDEVIFPEVPAVFDENAQPYISYEYENDKGEFIRSKELTGEGIVIKNVIIPYWLWKNFLFYIIDTEAAIDRLEIKEETNE